MAAFAVNAARYAADVRTSEPIAFFMDNYAYPTSGIESFP